MSRKRNVHYPQIKQFLKEIADDYGIEFQQYNEYHMRLMDGYTVLDVWTTGKYYVLETSYNKIAHGTIERQGEKGSTPTKKKPFAEFIHKLFFPMDYA